MTSENVNPWMLAQGHLRKVLDDHSYENWFSQTRFESFEDGSLVVKVPSQFFANWLRDHYLEAVSASLREVIPDFKEVQFVPTNEFGDGPPSAPSTPSAPVPPAERLRDAAQQSKRRAFKFKLKRHGFNRRYSFDRFVIGAGNRFAHAAAKAVVESPARAYNPLFLYGHTGLGKTHLMQAIGQELMQRDGDLNVAFITSELFTNQLIESIAKKSTQKFRAKYRKVDVLLIDDIHFIAGKEATQEEFFHTFNELFDMHKQIVLSSDRGPKEIQGLEDRLVSRFEWGLVTDIQPPDFETRMAILQNKAGEENIGLDAEVVRYIATCVTTNIRELEGALVTVLAYGRLTNQPVDLPLAEQVLRDLVGSAKLKPITFEGVQRAVAEEFDLRISDLRGRSRQRQIAYPRQIAMYLCKSLVPTMTLNAIGEAFGGKDHTTVLYACQKITDEIEQSESARQTVTRLEKTIRE